MIMLPIILASGSPRRKEILEGLGVQFLVRPSAREEKITETVPEQAVMELAFQKAEDIAEQTEEDCIVIGADTVVVNDGAILGKPADEEDAKRMLRQLQGHAHQVYTGVAVIIKEQGEVRSRTFAACTNVHVRSMTEEQICRYVALGESKDKAGAYAIQGKFAWYITGFEGDYLNVVGFPAAKLYEVMLEEGIDLAAQNQAG